MIQMTARPSTNRLRLAAALCSIAAVAALAVPAASARETAQPPQVQITLGGVQSLNYLAAYVADELGFFASRGIKITYDYTNNPAALISGDQNLALLSADTAFVTASQGQPTPILVALQQHNPSDMVVRKDLPGVAWNAKWPANIRSLPKGFTFGVPGRSGTNAYMKAVFGGAGLVEGRDYSVVSFASGAAIVAAMQTGQIDAAYAFAPFGGILTRPDGPGRHLLREARGEGPPDLLTRMGGTVNANRAWAAKNPGATKRFVAAIVQALQYMHHAKNRQRLIDIAVKYVGVTDRDAISSWMDDVIPISSPEVTCQRLGAMTKYEIEGGITSVRPPCDALRLKLFAPTKPIPPKILP